ncbi:MAG: hypothetical protein AAGA67_08245 [Cyanobacteria bacterium P01_F01_bin.153]
MITELIIFSRASLFDSQLFVGGTMPRHVSETMDVLRAEDIKLAMISSRAVREDKQDPLIWARIDAAYAMGAAGINSAFFSLRKGRHVYGILPFGLIKAQTRKKQPSEVDRQQATIELLAGNIPKENCIVVADEEEAIQAATGAGVRVIAPADFFGANDETFNPAALRVFFAKGPKSNC